MASYTEISERLPEKVRHWYVTGPDRGLVISAVRELREHALKEVSRVEYVNAESTPHDEIRALLLGASTLPEELPPLVVVESAESMDFTWMLDLASRTITGHLIAVGAEKSISAAEAPYSYFFKRQAGKAVVCKTPKRDKLITWIQRKLGCDKDVARTLLDSSRGDTHWLSHEVAKLSLLKVGESLLSGHIALVTPATSEGDFIDCVVRGDRKSAYYGIPRPVAAERVFRRLEQIAIRGALVYEAQKNVGWSSRQLVDRTGLSVSEIDMLRTHINTFEPRSTERRLGVLAKVSVRAVRGDRYAWLAIAALW